MSWLDSSTSFETDYSHVHGSSRSARVSPDPMPLETHPFGSSLFSVRSGSGWRSLHELWTGSLQSLCSPGSAGGCPPAPPQTRTSGCPAYGSSSDGYARPSARWSLCVYGHSGLSLPWPVTRLHPIPRQLPSLLPGSGGLRSPAWLRYYEAATTAYLLSPSFLYGVGR